MSLHLVNIDGAGVAFKYFAIWLYTNISYDNDLFYQILLSIWYVKGDNDLTKVLIYIDSDV